MGLTEDEAKTKWCPFARIAFESGSTNRAVVFDRASFDPKMDRCVGSACMAWRWVFIDKSTHERTEDGVRGEIDMDYTRGHCGLSGKP